MRLNIKKTSPVIQSVRVMQLSGIFDVAPTKQSESTWDINLPIEDQPWQVGLIVGASGSGKSTVARKAFPDAMVDGYAWPDDRSLVDAFPAELSIKDITSALSSVGFSSPPSWLRPFNCLSNGEQFRATLARAITEPRELVVVDEFTSVVDRTVAQIGSSAVSKAVRHRSGKQFVAVTCHYDIVDWLDPDWILEMPSGTFTRRLLRRRPKIELEICRVDRSAWELFKSHHYLSAEHATTGDPFCAFIDGRPVAYCSVIHFPHPKPGASFWREHRTVCLPDFQGVGIGNKLAEYVASLYRATGKAFKNTTSHPGLIASRSRSNLWRVLRAPSLAGKKVGKTGEKTLNAKMSSNRLTATIEYIGPVNHADARAFGIVK